MVCDRTGTSVGRWTPCIQSEFQSITAVTSPLEPIGFTTALRSSSRRLLQAPRTRTGRFASGLWVYYNIHKVTMTSFAITLYGQRCRLHVVRHRLVSDISVNCGCWSICSLCSEANNTTLLPHLFIDVLGTSSLLQIGPTKHRFPYNMASCTWWPWIQNLATSLHLIYSYIHLYCGYMWNKIILK